MSNPRFTVGDRIYEVLNVHGEKYVLDGYVMFNRGLLLKASMGREDGEYILRHASELPPEYRVKNIMVFPEWGDLYTHDATHLYWYINGWNRYWDDLNHLWYDNCRLMRRCL